MTETHIRQTASILISISVLLCAARSSGDLGGAQARIDSLDVIQANLEAQLSEIKKEVSLLRNRMRLAEVQENKSKGVKLKTTKEAPILERPSLFAEKLGTVPKGRSILVLGRESIFWKVVYKDIVGYVSSVRTEGNKEAERLFGVSEDKKVWQSHKSSAKNYNRTSDFPSAESTIQSKCTSEWPDDFVMRAHCIKRQREALATLRRGKPFGVEQSHFETIRNKCKREWPDDFVMWAHCEKRQFEALRELGY